MWCCCRRVWWRGVQIYVELTADSCVIGVYCCTTSLDGTHDSREWLLQLFYCCRLLRASLAMSKFVVLWTRRCSKSETLALSDLLISFPFVFFSKVQRIKVECIVYVTWISEVSCLVCKALMQWFCVCIQWSNAFFSARHRCCFQVICTC